MVLTDPVLKKPPSEDDFDEGGEYTGGGKNPYQKRKGGGSGPVQGSQPEPDDYEEEPEPDVEQEIEKVDHRVGRFYTVEAYQQFREEQFHKGVEVEQSIDPHGQYEYDGGIIPGNVLIAKIHREYTEPSRIAWEESLKIESGSVEIFRGYDGFEFRELKASDGPSLSGFGSYVLNIGDYAWSSLTGKTKTFDPLGATYKDKGNVFESPAMKESRLLSHQRDIVAWKKGDIGHFSGKILSNPYTLGMISMGLGTFSSALAASSWGSKAFMGSNLVSRGTAVQSFIGGASTGYMGGSASKVYSEQGVSGLRDYVGKMFLYGPVAIGGYQIGQSYGPSLVGKLGKFYDLPGVKQFRYQVGSFKETGIMVRGIRNQWDTTFSNQFFGRFRNLPGVRFIGHKVQVFKGKGLPGEYNLDSSRGNILSGSKFNRESIVSFEQLHGKYPDPFRSYRATETLGGYESSWSLYRSTLDIPKKIYPIKKSFIQPSRTFLIPTKSDLKFISFGGNQQYISYGKISPLESSIKFDTLGGGKKGGNLYGVGDTSDISRMFITGKESYIDYVPKGSATIYGSKGEATVRLFSHATLKEKSFYGIFSSKDIPTIGTSEYSTFFSSGSYRSYNPGSIKFSQEIPFSFGGRVFGETHYTKGISFVRQVGGGSQLIRTRIGDSNIFGSRTIELPRIDYAKSFSKIEGGNPFQVYGDTSFTLYPEPPKPKLGITGGGSKIDYTSKPEPSMGSNPFTSLRDVVQTPKYPSHMLGGFNRISIRTGLSQIKSFESGVYQTSSHWSNVFTGGKPNPSVTNVFTPSRTITGVGSVQNIGNVSSLSALSTSLSVNIPKFGLNVNVKNIADVENITDVVSDIRSDVSQSQIQRQQQKQMSITSLVPISISQNVNIPVVEPVLSSVFTKKPVIIEPVIFPMASNRIKIPFIGFDEESSRKRKKRTKFDIFDLGYKFRLFESGKFKYKSPFKI